ncbi:hypothetical protein GSH05_08875 [Burkholderia pseudomallei]|nr:hypothetical protein [Burkholderia pseudomallei]MBM5584326.1 hypothetical protein [Burkholderia pseudomallei]MBM5645710.1 hypothetical protein [Burkholderia pseudomallei]MBM5651773.1 hypothetical protein [Burkholderia pseudomallei]MBM5690140.1 hypothetical protein [Burkholderia pseudomallei]
MPDDSIVLSMPTNCTLNCSPVHDSAAASAAMAHGAHADQADRRRSAALGGAGTGSSGQH